MASTFSTNLALELIGTGDQAGTWGITTNTNLGTLIEQAISGYVTQAVATGTDTTITIPDGATGVARNMYIELTGTGGASTNLIVPANKKLYFIFNNSTGAVTVKVSGQTGISVPAGKKMVLVSNGTDIVNAANYVADFGSNSATITQLTSTSATITNLTLTSLVLSNLSIASANVTTLTSASATITNLLATSLTVSGNTFLATSSGNVGIGTSSPGYKLDANNSASGTIARFVNGVGRGYVRMDGYDDMTLQFYRRGASTAFIQTDSSGTEFIAGTTGAYPFTFYTNNAERMRLDSSGNLGIGTSSPGQKLEVNGAALVNGSTGFLRVAVSGSPSSGAAALQVSVNSTNARTIRMENTLAGGRTYDIINGAAGVAGNLGIFDDTAGAYRLTLDSSGNLGIGVTPDGNNLAKVFQLESGFTMFGFSNTSYLSANAYYNSGWKYKSTAAAAYYEMSGANGHRWNLAGSGTAGNAITFTQAMTLTAAGDLGLGTTTPTTYSLSGRHFEVDGSNGTYAFIHARTTNVRGFFAINNPDALAALFTYTNHPLTFGTNNTERARITAGGFFKASNTGAYLNSTASYHEINNDNDISVLVTRSTSTGGGVIVYNAQLPNSAAGLFFIGETGGAAKIRIEADGDVYNTNGTYGTISDARLKQDIVDANSQWDDLKSIRFRKYRMKADVEANPDAPTLIGVVAQELEQVCPGLVDDGEIKTVKSSILLMKAAKALQEAMARIEKLEAEVAALKGA